MVQKMTWAEDWSDVAALRWDVSRWRAAEFDSGLYTLGKYVSTRKWSFQQKREFCEGAETYAGDLCDRVLSPHYRRPSSEELAHRLGVPVVSATQSEATESYRYYGEFDPSCETIFINEKVIARVITFIAGVGLDHLAQVNLRNLIIAHKLFHALETRDADWATRYLPTWSLGRVLKRYVSTRTRRMASEVAAIHFSRLLTDIPFSPCVFEQVLADMSQGEISVR